MHSTLTYSTILCDIALIPSLIVDNHHNLNAAFTGEILHEYIVSLEYNPHTLMTWLVAGICCLVRSGSPTWCSSIGSGSKYITQSNLTHQQSQPLGLSSKCFLVWVSFEMCNVDLTSQLRIQTRLSALAFLAVFMNIWSRWLALTSLINSSDTSSHNHVHSYKYSRLTA